MSFKDDMNLIVNEKINTGSIEWNTSTCTDPESILDWIEWCIDVAHAMGKPTFCDRLSHRMSGD